MGLLETMKRVAEGTNNAAVPTAFFFGSVTKTSPLTIRVDNRFDISGEAIILTREFQSGFCLTHSHTEPGSPAPENENQDKTEYHYGLKAGEKVVLLRNQGGQDFLVLGRV